MASVFYQVIGENQNLSNAIFSLWQYVKIFYLPGVLTILLVHCLFLMIPTLQLYFYYYVWIKYIYGTLEYWKQNSNFKGKLAHWLLNRFFDNCYFYTLILNSFPEKFLKECSHQQYSDKIQKMSLDNKPVLIRREHLMKKDFWPKWMFATVLLFNKLTIERYQTEGKIKFRLKVDLRDQSYGIYNNAGKLFLKSVFLNDEFKSRCLKKSKEVEDFLKSLKSATSQANELTIDAEGMPFRWASGGVLSIALWKNKYWYVLYFRDIEPVGWNIANGASETKEEYKDLYNLIYREFSEELVLLSREPCLSDKLPITQKIFRFPFPLPEKISRRIENKEFFERHRRLRQEHDGLVIQYKDGPEVNLVNTPFEVEITYHGANYDTLSSRVSNIIFNVNPTEFGIEVLLISYFKMEEEDYLMDGEIWEGDEPALVRQPIMLLSCDYVQKIFNETGSLGTYVEETPYLNCKYLKKIPYNEYKIFDKDIEFRQQRLNKLLKKGSRAERSPEVERYKDWFKNYGEFFRKVKESRCDITDDEHKPLVTLCPVTWKTLEMICHYNLLNNIKS